MQIKCACGKLLKVPDTLAGKNVKCPACNKVLKIPAESPQSTPEAKAENIAIECSCGKRLAAPATAAGKRIRCPSCQAVLDVPTPSTDAQPSDPEEEAGFQLDITPPEPAPTSSDDSSYGVVGSQCPNCGAPLEFGSQFCVGCGTHLGSGSKVDGIDLGAIQQEKDAKKKSKLVVWGVIAGVVILLVVSAVLIVPKLNLNFNFGSKDDKPGAIKPAPKGGPMTQTPGQTKIKKEGDEGYSTMVLRAPTRARAKTAELAATRAVALFETELNRFPNNQEELETTVGFKLQELPDGLYYYFDTEAEKIEVRSVKDDPQPSDEEAPAPATGPSQ